jgi:enoyl-CoA hydratase/carnithine racemase
MPRMTDQRVTIETQDHVAHVRLVRGDKHNGLDGAMFLALRDAAREVRRIAGLRAVVLSGDGPSFCAGLDVASFFAEDSPIGMEALGDRPDGSLANLAQAVAYDWRLVPVPVIAAVHGNCFGGGLQIALGADIRIAAPDAKLSVMEIKWGLVPDMGLTVTLPPLVRQDVAKELTFTGRIVSGTEAVQLGLATRTAEDPLAAAQELAATIAGKSPDAIRSGKRLLNDAWDADDAPSLLLETELQVALLGSKNQMAAAQAAFTKQPGEFVDPAPEA